MWKLLLMLSVFNIGAQANTDTTSYLEPLSKILSPSDYTDLKQHMATQKDTIFNVSFRVFTQLESIMDLYTYDSPNIDDDALDIKANIVLFSNPEFSNINKDNVEEAMQDISFIDVDRECTHTQHEYKESIPAYMKDQYVPVVYEETGYACGSHGYYNVDYASYFHGKKLSFTDVSLNKKAFSHIQNLFYHNVISQLGSTLVQQDFFSSEYGSFNESVRNTMKKDGVYYDGKQFKLLASAYAFGTCYACGVNDLIIEKTKILPYHRVKPGVVNFALQNND